MSWKMEVATYHNGQEGWASNAAAYATKEEAEAAGAELLTRWTLPHAYRAVESTQPVNYRFDAELNKPVPLVSYEDRMAGRG
jgi:hypothetical protein